MVEAAAPVAGVARLGYDTVQYARFLAKITLKPISGAALGADPDDLCDGDDWSRDPALSDVYQSGRSQLAYATGRAIWRRVCCAAGHSPRAHPLVVLGNMAELFGNAHLACVRRVFRNDRRRSTALAPNRADWDAAI